jgi:hypothetical protein
MPFRETSRLEERIAMLGDYDTGVFEVSELCREYAVSRPTFYAWLARRAAAEADWFLDRSHAPHGCPHRTPAAVCAAVLEIKRRFPRFGPKKVRARLAREQPGLACPAASTVGDILKRAGWSRPARGAGAGRSSCSGWMRRRRSPTTSGLATSRGGSAPVTDAAAIR